MKRIITLVLTLAALLVLTVTACADTIPGTAKLTITPTDTKVSGDTATVTYSVTVTPPEGKELGVFSVQLQPSDGMTLAKDFYANGKQVITYGDGKLSYSEVKQTGYFATYEYTPQTGYFAAVGTTPERRMSKEATILTIQATMPANKSGTYTLNAEFIAALDGSGDVYTAQVSTTPVTVSGGDKAPVADKTPVITETDGSGNTTNTNDTTGAANNGTTPNGGTTTDGTAPNGTAPDGTTPDSTAPDGTTSDGTTPNGSTDAAGSSPILWIVLAAALIAAAVIVIVVKKKKQ
mgnify:CR=1 FL=1